MSKGNTIPVILCGGVGSRLWPLSKPDKPKQFMALPGTDLTLLQNTLIRLKEADMPPPIIVVQEEFMHYVEEQSSQVGVEIGHIILEPKANGTGFAAALAAFFISRHHELHTNMLIVPVDHYLENAKSLFETIKSLEDQNYCNPIIFGIKPTRYEPGYGYIQTHNVRHEYELYKVERFIEKPDISAVEKFLYGDQCYWNSGIFFFKAANLLMYIKNFLPQIYMEADFAMLGAMTIDHKSYINHVILDECVSIDKGIIEKLENLMMFVINMKWLDIGQLHSAWEISEKDLDGNFSSGNAFLMDTQDSYIVGNHKPTAVIGLKDVLVVNTDDAILVADKNSGSEISAFYNLFYSNRQENSLKPWGGYLNIEKGENFLIKKINVRPLQRTSLQSHKKRSEHWIVVDGIASVIIGNEARILNPGEGAYVPANTPHRIANDQTKSLLMVEIQIGEELSEEDIVRSEDDYGRV